MLLKFSIFLVFIGTWCCIFSLHIKVKTRLPICGNFCEHMAKALKFFAVVLWLSWLIFLLQRQLKDLIACPISLSRASSLQVIAMYVVSIVFVCESMHLSALHSKAARSSRRLYCLLRCPFCNFGNFFCCQVNQRQWRLDILENLLDFSLCKMLCGRGSLKWWFWACCFRYALSQSQRVDALAAQAKVSAACESLDNQIQSLDLEMTKDMETLQYAICLACTVGWDA